MNSGDHAWLRIAPIISAMAALIFCFDNLYAQQAVPHREACTIWGPVRGQYGAPYFGTVNSCDEAVAIQFMLLTGLDETAVIRRELQPHEVFNTGWTLLEMPEDYMFTTCPVGHTPNLEFAAKNSVAIKRSRYQCLKN